MEYLLGDVGALKLEDRETERELARISARIQRFADEFWISFREGRGLEGRFALADAKRGGSPAVWEGAEPDETSALPASASTDSYHALDNALNRLETTLAAMSEPPADAEGVVRRTRQLRFDLDFIIRGEDRKFVYWLERRGRGVFLR